MKNNINFNKITKYNALSTKVGLDNITKQL